MATGNTVIQNATIVNEGGRFRASVLIASGRIAQIVRDQELPVRNGDEVVDAEGALLLPGIIDGHVHMREPGLTHKADMESETRAAARGGVTTVLDMPNVVPQTTTLQLLQERYALAEGRCYVNYGFFLGATNNNIEEIKRLDVTQSPGVKLFMGSSTGNMLVDREEVLHRIFRESPTLIVAHCEDTERIKSEELRVKSEESELHLGNNGTFDSSLFTLHSSLPDDLPVRFHPLIRDHEACYRSSELAVRLAKEEGARLHVAHITTARELELFRPSDASAKGAEERFHPDDATANGAEERFHPDDASAKGAEERITAEACVPHLLFTDKDYETLGSRIKCTESLPSGRFGGGPWVFHPPSRHGYAARPPRHRHPHRSPLCRAPHASPRHRRHLPCQLRPLQHQGGRRCPRCRHPSRHADVLGSSLRKAPRSFPAPGCFFFIPVRCFSPDSNNSSYVLLRMYVFPRPCRFSGALRGK